MEQTLHGKAAVLLSENRNGGQVKRTSCNLLDGRVFTIFVSNLEKLFHGFICELLTEVECTTDFYLKKGDLANASKFVSFFY